MKKKRGVYGVIIQPPQKKRASLSLRFLRGSHLSFPRTQTGGEFSRGHDEDAADLSADGRIAEKHLT